MDSSGWEWSQPNDLRQLLKHEIKLSAQPLGKLGGGATPPGPVVSPD